MSKNKKNKRLLGLALTALALFLLSTRAPALAAPALQLTPFPTPTPGPDGRIIYIVQPNDTLLRISLISGVPVEQLRALNNIIGDNISAGQKLLLGLAGPSQATFTPGPSPTPTAMLPTPSPKPGFAELCVALFNDKNGDSIWQPTNSDNSINEDLIHQGAISISDRAGTITRSDKEAQDDAEDTGYRCFKELPEGDYTVTVGVPDGYNATTMTTYSIQLKAGDKTYVDFGAQPNSQAEAQAPAPTGSGPTPLLGIAGGLLLLAGAGLAVFAGWLLKGRGPGN